MTSKKCSQGHIYLGSECWLCSKIDKQNQELRFVLEKEEKGD